MGERNGFLEQGFDPVPRLTAVARAVGGFLRPGMHLLASHGDHLFESRGASETLDRELYDKSRGSEDMNRWDDCGRDVPEGL
jgi:hypothetical protein